MAHGKVQGVEPFASRAVGLELDVHKRMMMTRGPLFASLLLLGLAACGRSDPPSGEDAAAPGPAVPAVQTAALTGLYESDDRPANQMCVIDSGVGNARFGLVVWGAELHSCSGVGDVVREGETLRLAMTGDEECAIDARIVGTQVSLPAQIPEGCAYYCGARASLANARFEKVGDTAEDALRATDLVGDPLCAGIE